MSAGTYAYGGADLDEDLPESEGRERRRWPGTVLALLLVLCGAGGAVWFGQGDRAQVEVVVLARELPRGHVVGPDDLAVV
nr:SAF domain-containing protein [Micromonospora sp. DSM 115978]